MTKSLWHQIRVFITFAQSYAWNEFIYSLFSCFAMHVLYCTVLLYTFVYNVNKNIVVMKIQCSVRYLLICRKRNIICSIFVFMPFYLRIKTVVQVYLKRNCTPRYSYHIRTHTHTNTHIILHSYISWFYEFLTHRNLVYKTEGLML